MNKLCKVNNEDCSEKFYITKHLCEFHYGRQKKGLPLDAPKYFRAFTAKKHSAKVICKVNDEDCSKRFRPLYGLCAFHAYRLRKGVPLNLPKQSFQKNAPTKCKHQNDICSKYFRPTIGLCETHRYRLEKGIPPDAPKHFKPKTTKECQIGNRYCSDNGKESAKGFCKFHYKRYRDDPSGIYKPKKAQTKKIGSTYTDRQGYTKIKTSKGKSGWSFEHRLNMEKYLSRKLSPTERVHHRNGDKKNNSIENLELWIHTHPSGQRVSDHVEHALRILKQYAPQKLAYP